jgi:CspA family cold shock protein
MNLNVNVATTRAAGHSFDAERADGEADGETVVAVVRWFSEERGYGFVELPEGAGDAFLHAKVLRSVGLETVAPGATLRIVVDSGARGPQVTRVLDVDVSTSPVAAAPIRTSRTGARRPCDIDSAIELTGKVKFFDGVRGFGFVASDDFGRDVFVHCSILGGSKAARLVAGQPVKMRVVETPKGREAVELTA